MAEHNSDRSREFGPERPEQLAGDADESNPETGPESQNEDSIAGSLRSITYGASLSIGGKVILNVLKFVTNLLLTRGLNAALYGVYTYGYTLLSICTILGTLGTNQSVLRFLPKHEDTAEAQNAVLGIAYVTVFATSLLVAGGIYVTAPVITDLTLGDSLLTAVLRLLAIMLPFNTLANLTKSVFRATERLEYQVLIQSVVTPTVRILAIGTALLLGYSLIGVVAALVIATAIVLVVALVILLVRLKFKPQLDRTFDGTREFYNFSLPLAFKNIGSYMYSRVDLLMLGILLTQSDVGIYKVALIVSSLIVMPLTGFNQLFPPVASRLYSNDEMEELESVYRTVTRWTLTVALMPALGIIIYRAEVLAIFGSDFTVGASVLVLLTVAKLTNCAVGPCGYVLMMTEHQYLNLINQWTLGILNVALNYVLIVNYGFIGAAIATASILAGINVLRVVEIWYTEGLFPYSRQYWKPVTAGVGGAAVMVGWQLVLDGYLLLAMGGATGFLTFAALLYALGVEESDQEFFVNEIGILG